VGTIKSRVSRARGELVQLLSGDGLKIARSESAAIAGLDAGHVLETETLTKPAAIKNAI
jgi:hypothetical protein